MAGRIAVVIGVGPGLGASAARRFAAEGFQVALVSRKLENLTPVEAAIKAAGGKALCVPCDTGKPESVRAAFATIKSELGGSPEVLIYNAGPSGGKWPPPSMLDVPAETFADAFNAGVVGAYTWSQLCLPAMLAAGHGTILLTGATASLRGSAKFALLAAPKFALRALAQSLAREFQPQSIHVAHVIIDGGIDNTGVLARRPDTAVQISPDSIADTYWHLHSQHKSAWTLELELRPYTEKF